MGAAKSSKRGASPMKLGNVDREEQGSILSHLMTIWGTRHKCVKCPNYDSCSFCIDKVIRTHPDHDFVPILDPLPELAADMVPLFATVSDRDLALIQNDTFTSPEAVVAARRSDGHDGSTADVHIVSMPRGTPRFVKDDGEVIETVVGLGVIDFRHGPPKLIFMNPDNPPDPDASPNSDIASHDVAVYISPDMPSDEIGRRMLEAASRLPNHGRYVHEYKPLEPTTRDIRLVKLWPGEGDTSIRCETIHASFNENVSYEALSYTWGSPRSHGMIELNGRPFSTRENLEVALWHLRRKDEPRVLWIDALCIDQINVEERNIQVGRMQDIYKGASKVLVFLGPAEEDSDMAMDLITGDLNAGCAEAELPQPFELDFEQDEDSVALQENLYDLEEGIAIVEAMSSARIGNKEGDHSSESLVGASEGHQTHASNHHDGLSSTDQIVDGDEAEIPREFRYHSEEDEPEQKSDPERIHKIPKQRAWAALDKLARRLWFGRVWVLQEVAVSGSDPLILCGNRAVLWKEFDSFLNIHGSRSSLLDNFKARGISTQQRAAISACYRIQLFFRTRQRVQNRPHTTSIFNLLTGTLKLEATEPRDKVFALVGLASEHDRIVLAPDYSKSMAQVYAETAKHIIISTGRLDILSFNTNSENAHEPLPSWVPDWRLGASRPYPLWASGIYRASELFSACVRPPHIDRSYSPNELVLGGILIDEVLVVSDVIMPLYSPSSTDPLGLKDCIRKLERLLLMSICRLKSNYPNRPTNPSDAAAWRRIFALDPDPRNSDQFWRTLVTNRTLMNESPAPAVYAEIFEMLFYQSADAPARRVIDDGLRSRVGLDFPRLQMPQSSRIPRDYRPELSYAERLAEYTKPLVTAMARLSCRVFFITKAGRMGIASPGVRPRDKVVVLMGGDVPFILRDRNERGTLQFIGESYVHGVMNGEAFGVVPAGDKIEKHMLLFSLY